MDSHLRIAEFLANALDNQFSILGFRFGLSAVIDLVPELGDIVDVCLSLYLVWIALQVGLPRTKIMRMIINIGTAFFIGIIPFFGDIGYIFLKPNLKNLKILKEYATNNLQLSSS